MRYSEPRYTKDLDLWVKPEAENSQRVFRSLAEFGAPLGGVSADDFAKEDLIYQLGVPPIRVDIITSLSGVEFSSAWERRTESEFGGVQARFIGLDDLLTNQRSVGRLRSSRLRTLGRIAKPGVKLQRLRSDDGLEAGPA
jgi:hypothetical protein